MNHGEIFGRDVDLWWAAAESKRLEISYSGDWCATAILKVGVIYDGGSDIVTVTAMGFGIHPHAAVEECYRNALRRRDELKLRTVPASQ